jgi:hypothetical protein
METNYLALFEDHWQNEYRDLLVGLESDLKARNKQILALIVIFVSFVAGLVLWFISEHIYLPLPAAATLYGIYYYRQHSPSDQFVNRKNEFRNAVIENIYRDSSFKWHNSAIADLKSLESHFRSLFEGEDFSDVQISNPRSSRAHGADITIADVVAKVREDRQINKTRLINGKVQHYTETVSEEVQIFGGLMSLIKFDDFTTLKAAGHMHNGSPMGVIRPHEPDLETVGLESTEFEDKIHLYANHQRQIRELFTPDLMSEIIDWLDSFQGHILFEIEGKSIVFATNQSVDFWPKRSPSLKKQKQKLRRTYHFYAHLESFITRIIYFNRHRLDNWVE